MKLYGWAELFEERRTLDDIPARVRKTETAYWLWVLFSIVVGMAGFGVIVAAPEQSLKAHFIGLFLVLEGGFLWVVIKLWVHIRLSLYWTIWDRRNRLAAEQLRVDAEDL